jgi:hypothetical protein
VPHASWLGCPATSSAGNVDPPHAWIGHRPARAREGRHRCIDTRSPARPPPLGVLGTDSVWRQTLLDDMAVAQHDAAPRSVSMMMATLARGFRPADVTAVVAALNHSNS